MRIVPCGSVFQAPVLELTVCGRLKDLVWTRELHLFLELSCTSLLEQVPDPGLLHRPARAPGSRPWNSREGSPWAADLAAQVPNGSEVFSFASHSSRRPSLCFFFLGNVLRRAWKPARKMCFYCEELGRYGVLVLRWASVMHLHLCPCFSKVFVG